MIIHLKITLIVTICLLENNHIVNTFELAHLCSLFVECVYLDFIHYFQNYVLELTV